MLLKEDVRERGTNLEVNDALILVKSTGLDETIKGITKHRSKRKGL